ncbi:NADP oxidoreductase coenzyme F420-dependent [Penicillium concentricum]|uniref:NADP oxidoreductase coenzyme F420-dependent n=1 Tax=Penicillium concentricum TaxID=293559 RepID=A0A9W9SBG3_9EURO|nr:NADP oxidoreductase coenzyme F420-dependent [Penicillium concentricum]KAJ5374089.1 NADP oxidoreductase coenzyme F420-dependent [Penicillium concentricum]
MASGQTLGFIGCGNMGGAVLNGLLNSAFSSKSTETSRNPISRFIACTKTATSASRLQASIAPEHQDLIKIVSDQNVQTMQEADIIILGCKPFMAEAVLGEKGVRDALAGKLVISMLAGPTCPTLTHLINPDPDAATSPHLMKAIPNMGAQFGQSMTIIETPAPRIPQSMVAATEWIFKHVGAVKYLGPEQIGLATVLVGATMATLTLPIEGLLDGCVAEGFKRADAMELVLQGIRGLSAVLESGQHPAVVRESISSPRGCTIQTLLSLEKAGTRSDFAEAIVRGNTHLKEKM